MLLSIAIFMDSLIIRERSCNKFKKIALNYIFIHIYQMPRTNRVIYTQCKMRTISRYLTNELYL